MNEDLQERIGQAVLGRYSRLKRAAVLQLWRVALKRFVPDIEPEASYFTDLMEWLDAVTKALEA